MAFYINGAKISRVLCNAQKLSSVFCDFVKVYASEFKVKFLLKTPRISDRFNNLEIATFSGNEEQILKTIASSCISEKVDKIPLNRYTFLDYVDNGNKSISQNTIIDKDITVYYKVDYGNGTVEFVNTDHVHFPTPNIFEAKYSSDIEIPEPAIDNGYEKDGDFIFEQLMINDDGVTESWKTYAPQRSKKSSEKNWHFTLENPMKITQPIKRKTYTVSFDPNINTLNSMLLKAWSFSGIVYYKEEKSFYSTSAKPKAFSYLFEDTIGNVEIREKPSVTVDDNSYSITFDANGGTGTVSIPLQAKHSQKAAPKADWYTTANGSQKWSSDEKISGNITLYAQWEIIEDYYKVSPVDIPTVQKEHYDLLGWSLTKNGTVQESIQNQVTFNGKIKQMSNVTIFAKWTPHKYTVTFDGNGHDIDNIPSQLVTYNQHADNIIPTGINDGYTFVEWCTDAECTQKYSFNTPVTSDITLYAKWKLGQPEVVFNANGHGNDISVTVNYGDKVTKPTDPTAAGYIFGGWYTNSSCTIVFDFNTAIKTYTVLYAKWTEAPTFEVTFWSNDKGYFVSQTSSGTLKQDAKTVKGIEYGSKLSAPSDIPIDSNGRYGFDGWYTDKSCTNAYNFNTPVTANLNLYAKWRVIQCIVKFYDKREYTAPITSEVKVNTGSKVTKPANPTYTGYDFLGWYTDSGCTKAYDFNSAVTTDITLYAKWVKLCVITYSTANNVTPSRSTQTVRMGEAIGTLATATKPAKVVSYSGDTAFGDIRITQNYPNDPNRTSPITIAVPYKVTTTYSFLNWDYNGTVINSSSKLTSNITVYANWKETTTTKYDSVKLPTLSWSGYTMLGYYTAASGGTKVANNGATYTTTKQINLYAHWQKK